MSNIKTYNDMIKELNKKKGNKLLGLYTVILNNLEKECEDSYHVCSSTENYFSRYTEYFDINIDDFKNVPISCTIHSNAREVELSYNNSEDGSKYLEIIIKECSNVYYSAEKKELSPSKTKSRKKVIIFENLTVYQQRVTGGLYPSTMSSLSELTYYGKKINLTVVNSIYEYFSREHVLFKDIHKESCKDLIFLPIKINDIWNYSSKLELLKGYMKSVELPRTINKFDLQSAYLLAKCKKYVSDKEWQKLYILNGNISFSRKLKIREQIVNCFYRYYKIKCEQNGELTEDEIDYINDYIYMIWEYSNPKIFDLRLNSVESVKKAHDKAVKEIYISKTPNIKINKNSKFKNLNLGEEFELIKTRKRLIEETINQSHCIWSRGVDINNDDCMVYSTVYNGKRYTLEISVSRKSFYLREIRGFANSSAPAELIDIIETRLCSQDVYIPRKTKKMK